MVATSSAWPLPKRQTAPYFLLPKLVRPATWVTKSSSNSSSSQGAQDGDKLVQDTLADILRLQQQELEVNQLVSEKSKLLTDIVQSAEAEYEQISSHVKKGMEEASAKVIQDLDSEIEELEKEMAQSRAQIEADELEFEKFEKDMVKSRNSGLFFQSLFQPVATKKNNKSSATPETIKAEANRVTETTKGLAARPSRIGVYIALGLLLGLTILEAAGSGESWEKVAIYSVLLVFLLLQIKYESSIAGGNNKVDKSDH